MNVAEFLETVRREAPLESEDAARDVAVATLQTMGERISDSVASDVADDLPDHFADALTSEAGEAESFEIDEFEGRVSERADVPEGTVVEHARAVATAVAEASDGLDAAREQLPDPFGVVFERPEGTGEAP